VGGRAFLARQLQQGILNDGTKLPYAFGLEVLEYRGLPMVEHSGSTGGYRTAITRFPTKHTSVATMCNVSTANALALTHGVADIVLASSFTKPAPVATRTASVAQSGATPATYTAAALDRFTGRYYSDELDATFEIARAGSGLLLRRPRSAPDSLRSLSIVNTFRAGNLTLAFQSGSSASPAFTVDAGRARGIEFRRVTSDSR
jgi:hypothetical protein